MRHIEDSLADSWIEVMANVEEQTAAVVHEVKTERVDMLSR